MVHNSGLVLDLFESLTVFEFYQLQIKLFLTVKKKQTDFN